MRALNETLPTLTALEGPIAPMSPVTGIQSWIAAQGICPLVLGQCGCLLKDQPLSAFVGLLASVLALVLSQGRAVPEALATVVALVGPFLCVRPQVQEQACGPREGLPAHAAGVWPLARVCAPVPAKGGVLVESTPAVLALIGLFPGMNPAVHGEVRAVAEALTTLGALIGLVARVDTLMLHQRGVLAECLAAFSAHVGPLACVYAPVHREVRVVAEGLPAVHTFVRLFPHQALCELHTCNGLERG